MKILVLANMIPDLVEELSIDESGTALDMTWARMIINEFDDHAIEQAILLKENFGGEVIVVAIDADDVDDVLFTAAAKGADRLIKLCGASDERMNNHARARAFGAVVKDIQPDIVLAGVQAHDDLDGQVGPLLAAYLEYPYVGYIAGVGLEEEQAVVRKEYPGGLQAQISVTLPAVIGIQAAESPPRYVAFSKVRQAMQTASIEEMDAAEIDLSGAADVSRMYQPEVTERAEMLEGSVEDIAAKIFRILKEAGVVKEDMIHA